MMKSIRISVLALTALVFPGFTAAGTDSAAPISADSPGPSSNPFSSDDVSKFDQVYAQFLRDHHTFLDIQGRFEGDKEKDFWFKCFEFHEPKLFALSEHLKETEELLRLSTKMGNPADEGHVLHSLMFPLSDAQSDIREIRPFMDGLAKCSTDPRFSEGHAALDNATRPVADALDRLWDRWKEAVMKYPPENAGPPSNRPPMARP